MGPQFPPSDATLYMLPICTIFGTYKVGNPNLVTLLNRTPIIEWYVELGVAPKKRCQKVVCLKEIALCV